MSDHHQLDAKEDHRKDAKDTNNNPPIYWSVLHHKNIHEDVPLSTNYKDIHNTSRVDNKTIPIEVKQQPPARSQSALAADGYGSTTSEHKPPSKMSKWSKVRELVNENELLIRDMPEQTEGGDLNKKKRWSDLSNMDSFELTLRECLMLFLLLLAIGVIAYSYLFSKWELIDSLYFTIVMLTTVGYGDITPETVGGRLFASIFALAGIVLLGLVLGVVGSQIVEAEISFNERIETNTRKAIDKAFTKTRHGKRRLSTNEQMSDVMKSHDSLSSLDSIGSTASEVVESSHTDSSIYQHHKHDARFARFPGLFYNHLPGLLPMIIGAILMTLLEKWKWYDAVYFCIVTSTSIGFGDLTPSTTLSKFVACIFIPIAVASMGYILGNVASHIVEKQRAEYVKKLWSSQIKLEDIEALDEANEGGVNKLEYIKFMLVAMKKIDADLFDDLHDQFNDIDVTRDGLITKRDLKIIASRKLKRVNHKLELSEYKARLKRKCNSKSSTFGFSNAVKRVSDKVAEKIRGSS